MNKSEITIELIEPTEEQEREYEKIRNLVNSWFHLISVDQDESEFCNKFKESISNLKHHIVTEIDLSDLIPKATIKRLSNFHPIKINQIIEDNHDT